MADLTSKALILGATALVACGASDPPPAAPVPKASSTAKTDTQVKYEADALARLRALQVFTVTEVVAGQPEERFSCYGPCSALGQLAGAAERGAQAAPKPNTCDDATIRANLAIIEGLNTVKIGGLVPGDEKEKCARAAKLANIADLAKGVHQQ